MNLLSSGAHPFYAFLLIFARTSGAISTAPVLGARSLPRTLKAGLALIISLAITPLLDSKIGGIPNHVLLLAAQIAGEAFLGVALGFIARLFFSAIEMAGYFIDTQMGFGFLTLANPFAEQQSSALGIFEYQLATTLYLLMNGHLLFIGSIIESFGLISAGSFAPQAALGSSLIPITQALFLLCFRIALPAIGVLITIEIAFGLMARMVPTLNVFFIGAPGKIILGLTTVAFLMPAFALLVGQAMAEASAGMSRLISAAK